MGSHGSHYFILVEIFYHFFSTWWKLFSTETKKSSLGYIKHQIVYKSWIKWNQTLTSCHCVKEFASVSLCETRYEANKYLLWMMRYNYSEMHVDKNGSSVQGHDSTFVIASPEKLDCWLVTNLPHPISLWKQQKCRRCKNVLESEI